MHSRTRWRVADQILSGLTVVGLSFVVARSAEVGNFGVFGVALLASGFVLGLSRAMVGDVFLIQFSDVPPRVLRPAAKEATGGAVLLGLVTGAALALRASGRGDLLRQVALLQAMFLLGFGLLGAQRHGVRGAAVGLVAAHVIGAGTLWALFLRESGRRDEAPAMPVRL